MDNFYELLGISPTAPDAVIRSEITKAQRIWMRRTALPDLDRRQEAERMMRRLAAAKDILLDPLERAAYDRTLTPSTVDPVGVPDLTPHAQPPPADPGPLPDPKPYAPDPFQPSTQPTPDKSGNDQKPGKDAAPKRPPDPLVSASIILSVLGLLGCPGFMVGIDHPFGTALAFFLGCMLSLWGVVLGLAGTRRTVAAGGTPSDAGAAHILSGINLAWIAFIIYAIYTSDSFL